MGREGKTSKETEGHFKGDKEIIQRRQRDNPKETERHSQGDTWSTPYIQGLTG